MICARNTRYRLARWLRPQGEYLIGELPSHQHHQCQVTQPLLYEQLREWGIDISRGQIEALLSAGQDAFHCEQW